MNVSATFDWKSEKNPIVGTIRKPMAVVSIRDNKGYWKKFSFKIDSGADMTAMNADDCSFLGYNITDGKKIEFEGIGGIQEGYIHKVDMLIGSEVLENVRIAFMSQPISELLLGRLEVFHSYHIDLRGKIGKTHFIKA